VPSQIPRQPGQVGLNGTEMYSPTINLEQGYSLAGSTSTSYPLVSHWQAGSNPCTVTNSDVQAFYQRQRTAGSVSSQTAVPHHGIGTSSNMDSKHSDNPILPFTGKGSESRCVPQLSSSGCSASGTKSSLIVRADHAAIARPRR
jgi:hypothetical protein